MKITATFRLVEQRLNQLRHRVPTNILLPLPGFETRPIQFRSIARYPTSCKCCLRNNLPYMLQSTRLKNAGGRGLGTAHLQTFSSDLM